MSRTGLRRVFRTYVREQLTRRVAITGMLPIPLIIFALIVRLMVGG